jgi:Zn-dependent peptidase ImmA (M78 family)
LNYSSFHCDFLRNEEIWKEADKCYLKYRFDESIPVDVEYIAEKMGLDIIPEYFPEYFDAFLSLDGKAILINSARDERYNSRIRFSVAHEIGHFILHQETFKNFHFEDLADYISFIQEISEKEYQSFEYQANEFAGRLLIPRDQLKKRIDEAISLVDDINFESLVESSPDQVLASMSPFLAKPFDVSEIVVKIRAGREGLWPPKFKK